MIYFIWFSLGVLCGATTACGFAILDALTGAFDDQRPGKPRKP